LLLLDVDPPFGLPAFFFCGTLSTEGAALATGDALDGSLGVILMSAALEFTEVVGVVHIIGLSSLTLALSSKSYPPSFAGD
jgi:hypothetical protein